MEVNTQISHRCTNPKQMDSAWMCLTEPQQCAAEEAPKQKTIVDTLQASTESATVLSLTSVATGAITKTPINYNAVSHLFGGQFVSKLIRSEINQYTDNSAMRICSHATVQALRNAYLDPTPTSIFKGAIDGAGYSMISDMADSLKDNDGKSKPMSLAITIAGTYLTEMAEALVTCRSSPALCSVSKLKALVAATLLTGYQVYSYATEA